jgi:hypothetical protein
MKMKKMNKKLALNKASDQECKVPRRKVTVK